MTRSNLSDAELKPEMKQTTHAASTSGDEPVPANRGRESSIPAVPSPKQWEEGEQASDETMALAHEFVKSAGSVERAEHILQLLVAHQQSSQEAGAEA